MSATVGTDASNWMEYYFTCTAGGGHDSGWISMNKYTDVGLTPGTAILTRSRCGTRTAIRPPRPCARRPPLRPHRGTASFAYGPVGISSSADHDGRHQTCQCQRPDRIQVHQKPDRRYQRMAGFPEWTNSGLTSGLQLYLHRPVRDGRGNTSAPILRRWSPQPKTWPLLNCR